MMRAVWVRLCVSAAVLALAAAGARAQECDPDVCANPWANQNVDGPTGLKRVGGSGGGGGTSFAFMGSHFTVPNSAGGQSVGVTNSFYMSLTASIEVNGGSGTAQLAAVLYFDMPTFQWYLQATATVLGSANATQPVSVATGTDVDWQILNAGDGAGLSVNINFDDTQNVQLVTGVTPDTIDAADVRVGFALNGVTDQTPCSVLPTSFSAAFNNVTLRNADGSVIPLGLTANTPALELCALAMAVDNTQQTATVTWDTSARADARIAAVL